MKSNLYSQLALFVLATLCLTPKALACGYDFVGSCATSARFSVNDIQNEYLVRPCSYGLNFPSTFGTNITALQLTGGSTRTWESCLNNVKESAIYYRVYREANNKGTFQKADLTTLSTLNAPPYRTKTYSGNLSVDLISGLLPNTAYTLEVYLQVGIDTDENGTVDATKSDDNAGLFYKSTFTTGNIAVSGFPTTVTTTAATCSNASNGSASVTTQGGTAPFTYAWSVAGTTSTVNNLAAGNYSVTITDATGAVSAKGFTISAPAPVSVSLNATNAGCGLTNGSIAASVTGGTPPYVYTWSNGTVSQTISNLTLGNYTLTVTDSKGCTGTGSAVISENCGTAGNYCNSNAQAPWTEWLARVQFANIDNTSSKTRSDRYALGYSDFKDVAGNVTKGQTYVMTVTPGLSYPSYQTDMYFRVWIDFNKDGIFNDTEKVFEKNAVSAAVTNPVLIPTTALSGSTIMRVIGKKGSYPTACETFAAGEVEDYTLIVAAGTSNCTNDTTIPVFVTNCPANITLVTPATTAVATWTAPSATDNCTASPTITSNFTSGQSFPVGTTTVTYTARDAANNAATCSFTVTVSNTSTNPCDTDGTAPVFAGCPANINLLTTTATAIANWAAPTATDNCPGTPSVSSNFSSGTAFPLGATQVTYTATDAKNNIGTCRFTITVTQQSVGGGVCKKYTAQNTNEICAQTWKPYGMVLVVGAQRQLLQAQSVVFENRGDTAASIRGTFRTPSWAAVVVNINLTGGTAVAPSGSPRTSTCVSGSAGYVYFTTMTGTVNINSQNLTITRRGAAFQIGNGANTQNAGELGGSGEFTLSDNTQGEFGFKMVNQTTCVEPDPQPLLANHKPILDLEAKAILDKVELNWISNSSVNTDYYQIEKVDAQGNFKTVETQNEIHEDKLLHNYTAYDAPNTEGVDAYYRVKTIGKDGAIAISDVKKVSIINTNDIMLYPNPASDNVNISLKQYENKEVKILIYNTLGILERTIDVDNTHDTSVSIDINDLPKGQHFVRISAQGRREAMKVFIKSE
jgi:hypothetical protein